jgi:branched-chain amino acid transport system permease protein
MEMFFQQLVFGVTVGATYALVALGFSMQFRAMNLLNFAHGESFMMGAFIGLLCHVSLGLPLWVTWLMTMAACGVAGVIIEYLAIRPLYLAPVLNLFISTIGLSLVLRQVAMILSGAIAFRFPPTIGEKPVNIGGVAIVPEQIWVLGVAVFIMYGFEQYLKKTRSGKAMRAVAQEPYVAALMGISVLRIKSLVYALSTMLGGAAGLLFAPLLFVTFDMGLGMGIKGFICACIGGMGSIPGAILGGFVLGVVEQFSAGYISSLYKDAISFCILILVISIFPRGLLIGAVRGSEKWREKIG